MFFRQFWPELLLLVAPFVPRNLISGVCCVSSLSSLVKSASRFALGSLIGKELKFEENMEQSQIKCPAGETRKLRRPKTHP